MDPGFNSALPRMPLPDVYTKTMSRILPNVMFASNPCRIRFCTQEIVIFREDLLRKMQRHVVVPLMIGPDNPDITEQLVESILDQVLYRRTSLHVV